MNNEEPTANPLTPKPEQIAPEPTAPQPTTPEPTAPGPIPAPANPQSAWVPKAEYDVHQTALKQQRTDDLNKSKNVRAFYRLLAVGGLLVFVLYIGMLLWPYSSISRGNCTGQAYAQVAFWLNPAAYTVLFTAGIVGLKTKRRMIVVVSILLVILAPIAWIVTGLGILGPILCGV